MSETRYETRTRRGERIQREVASQFRLGHIVAALGDIVLREAERMRRDDFNEGFVKGYRAARQDHEAGRGWRAVSEPNARSEVKE